ncbi:MAG: phenylacetate-CoA oxygenase, PaaI subunit [Crocinitomicaceae bacterium]|jgi:ring-1,2-phenylacetyl-CoA epoxidase subunit PaaC|nr:phenylacetate-CoA oxygenase, PaaI subunit [Crocinitomicaceae bacterium]
MKELFEYTLRMADDSLILGHRVSEWCGHGPILEEDIALTNIALDLVGQATNLLEYAAVTEGSGRSADDLAFLRFDRDFRNLLLVEQKNGDFAVTLTRQFFFDAFRKPFFEALAQSKDEQLAAIAEKSLKETKYHLKHSSEWMIRLGDGTEESHARVQQAVNDLARFTEELFYMDEVDQKLISEGIAVDLNTIKPIWKAHVDEVFAEANLEMPEIKWPQKGGRQGMHSEHLGYLLAEMQFMQRAYPGMEW